MTGSSVAADGGLWWPRWGLDVNIIQYPLPLALSLSLGLLPTPFHSPTHPTLPSHSDLELNLLAHGNHGHLQGSS